MSPHGRHSHPKQKLRLTISAAASARQYLPYLRRHLRAAHQLLNPRLVDFTVVLVGDSLMSQLHARFMNVNGTTDALTFPLEIDSRGRVIGGEVYVCVAQARRRCREHGVELRDELLLYALHGMLHLCGFDDRTASGFDRMHRMEDRILRQLGVGPVFAGSTAS